MFLQSQLDIHKNARLTPFGRERLAKMVLGRQTPQVASKAVGVCPRAARKWVDRFEQEGLSGLQDRSSTQAAAPAAAARDRRARQLYRACYVLLTVTALKLMWDVLRGYNFL